MARKVHANVAVRRAEVVGERMAHDAGMHGWQGGAAVHGADTGGVRVARMHVAWEARSLNGDRSTSSSLACNRELRQLTCCLPSRAGVPTPSSLDQRNYFSPSECEYPCAPKQGRVTADPLALGQDHRPLYKRLRVCSARSTRSEMVV